MGRKDGSDQITKCLITKCKMTRVRTHHLESYLSLAISSLLSAFMLSSSPASLAFSCTKTSTLHGSYSYSYSHSYSDKRTIQHEETTIARGKYGENEQDSLSSPRPLPLHPVSPRFRVVIEGLRILHDLSRLRENPLFLAQHFRQHGILFVLSLGLFLFLI